MSEPSGKLKAKELHSLLDHLHDYLKSQSLCLQVCKNPPDVAGNVTHLDGNAFLAGFQSHLETVETEPEKFMDELDLIMELSIYVRNGGISAILYRLETGSAGVTLSIIDSIAAQLTKNWQGGKFNAAGSLFHHLQGFNADDQSRVAAIINELDSYLLEVNGKLEDLCFNNLCVEKNLEQGPG